MRNYWSASCNTLDTKILYSSYDGDLILHIDMEIGKIYSLRFIVKYGNL